MTCYSVLTCTGKFYRLDLLISSHTYSLSLSLSFSPRYTHTYTNYYVLSTTAATTTITTCQRMKRGMECNATCSNLPRACHSFTKNLVPSGVYFYFSFLFFLLFLLLFFSILKGRRGIMRYERRKRTSEEKKRKKKNLYNLSIHTHRYIKFHKHHGGSGLARSRLCRSLTQLRIIRSIRWAFWRFLILNMDKSGDKPSFAGLV
ncbi:hypothetical protein F4810DRAFT_64404 [Camillea tinctor]|nr:hypothetical protein F4810DRAFT_64404 [Camillea tinctor]